MGEQTNNNELSNIFIGASICYPKRVVAKVGVCAHASAPSFLTRWEGL